MDGPDNTQLISYLQKLKAWRVQLRRSHIINLKRKSEKKWKELMEERVENCKVKILARAKIKTKKGTEITKQNKIEK